ncbi:hypothetical protein EYF80_056306 [Liparis tanakae]|uniref:Uncharacterized protein n=1 Tax=Liparis tanakae TaxID=230148 RepID=A0A4Z2EXR2_9TELE|nr:hypothetical protein EYF80_056306 [Liparis tanakae]
MILVVPSWSTNAGRLMICCCGCCTTKPCLPCATTPLAVPSTCRSTLPSIATLSTFCKSLRLMLMGDMRPTVGTTMATPWGRPPADATTDIGAFAAAAAIAGLHSYSTGSDLIWVTGSCSWRGLLSAFSLRITRAGAMAAGAVWAAGAGDLIDARGAPLGGAGQVCSWEKESGVPVVEETEMLNFWLQRGCFFGGGWWWLGVNVTVFVGAAHLRRTVLVLRGFGVDDGRVPLLEDLVHQGILLLFIFLFF